MPTLLFRHGQTDKNIHGGVDSWETPLNETGQRQSLAAGRMLADFCRQNGIDEIQPIVSGIDSDHTFTRTATTAQLMLSEIAATQPGISIRPLSSDPRIRDIKFRQKGSEIGSETIFSDGRELAEETLAAVLARVDGFYRDCLAHEPAADILRISVAHTMVGRLLVARHVDQSFEYVEDNIPALNNLQGLAFTAAGVSTVFDGFALSDEQRQSRGKLQRSGAINIQKQNTD